MKKHKSYTPMPYRKTRAGSYNTGNAHSSRPFILGVSPFSFFSFWPLLTC